MGFVLALKIDLDNILVLRSEQETPMIPSLYS